MIAGLTRNARRAVRMSGVMSGCVTDAGAALVVQHATSRASGAGGAALSGDQPSLSRSGRFVAFKAQDNSLNNGTNGPQAWVRDRQSATTTLASRRSGDDGDPAAGAADQPDVSADGQFVVFRSAAKNLSDEDADSTTDIFERDLNAATTTLVSRADGPAGAAADGGSDLPSVSDDGRRVLFRSTANNLSPDDDDRGDNGYVRDVVAGTTTLVHGLPGQTPPPQSVIAGVSLSGNGLFATYDTSATLLPGTESGSHEDVFRRELGPATPPPAPPKVSVGDGGSVVEGGPGAVTQVSFPVTLSAASDKPMTVQYSTTTGSPPPEATSAPGPGRSRSPPGR